MKERSRFVKYMITGSLMLHIRKYLDKLIGYVMRNIVYRKGEIQNNKIFVMTYDNSFTCNPKYIVEELLRRNLPVDIVWVVDKKTMNSYFPQRVRKVMHGSYEMFEEQASAKIWIDNALNCVWFEMPKKKKQIYFNTWHGSMGIKRLNGNKTWLWHARNCNKKTDFCITNSTFEENVFHDTFWPDVTYLRFGHARNDILFADGKKKDMIDRKVRKFYNVPDDAQICMYAPTFRDNGTDVKSVLDYEMLHRALKQRFGGEWYILVRAHFKNRSKDSAVSISDNYWMLDGSLYSDMQELMVAVNIGITDYSSWAYDYVLTHKPLFIFAPDIADYDQMRGFYYPIESTPFSIGYDNNQLIEKIVKYDEGIYNHKIEEFLKGKGCYEEGNAAKKVVDKIVELMCLQEDKK